MNKLILFLVILTIVAFACAPKASIAVTDLTIPSESSVSNDAAAIEAGHTIFTTKCTKCHKAKPVEKSTYEELRRTLASMVKKAKLNNTEISQVSAYIHANSKK